MDTEREKHTRIQRETHKHRDTQRQTLRERHTRTEIERHTLRDTQFKLAICSMSLSLDAGQWQ